MTPSAAMAATRHHRESDASVSPACGGTQPALALLATLKERYRGKPGWPFVELKTGHDAMVSAPEALTRLLLEAA